VEKFELLLTVLRDLQKAGILRHFILVGSWCQEFYRYLYHEPVEIPATRTMDADLLIPKRLPASVHGNIVEIMEKNDFAVDIDYPSGLIKFVHQQLNVEFLTDPGAKPDEAVYRFQQFGVTAQELRYMSIPLSYKQTITYKDILLNIPEPEAFTLHKLIVCTLRKKPEKAIKDAATAKGMLLFFEGKKQHVMRIREIYHTFPKGWKKLVDKGLGKTGLQLPE
jgi:hypothetical protein